MSLFKARRYWETRCGDGREEFDSGGLVVANIDNDPAGTPKLVTGSLHGVLRVHRVGSGVGGSGSSCAPEDLLLEQRLNAPILQLLAGRFLPQQQEAGRTALAVLHPRSLAVYAVVAAPPSASGLASGAYHTLERRYEHALGRTAASMVAGPFGGGVRDHDDICVLSMDGELAVFEGATHAFSRFLSGFVIPGPMCYLPRTDSLVIANSQLQVECYRFQDLASISTSSPPTSSASTSLPSDSSIVDSSQRGGNGGGGSGGGVVSQRRLQPVWVANLGEMPNEILVGRLSRSLAIGQTEAIILCERTLHCIGAAGGAIGLQKRINPGPACSTVYPLPNVGAAADEGGASNNDGFIVCTHEGTLLMFRDVQLVWAATLSSVPVAVRVDQLGGVDGMIATLDEDGTLAVQYLGTDPAVRNLIAASDREPDYTEMDAEMRKLESTIRELSTTARPEPADLVTLVVQDVALVPSADARRPPTATAQLLVGYTGHGSLSGVQVAVSVRRPITTFQPLIPIQTVAGGDAPAPLSFPVSFGATSKCLPSSLDAEFVASFTGQRGEPRTAKISIALPFALACMVVGKPRSPSAAHKVTISTNRGPMRVRALFDDIPELGTSEEDPSGGGGGGDGRESPGDASSSNVATLRFFARDVETTVLGSKSAGRYRLQSNEFAALWLPTQALCKRLEERFRDDVGVAAKRSGEGEFRITLPDKELPLDSFFGVVDAHLEARHAQEEAEKQLENAASQYRAVQKRLLMRFKDRNAVPLEGMDLLLDRTQGLVMSLAAKVSAARTATACAGDNLEAAVRLLQLLIRLRFGLDSKASTALDCYLPVMVDRHCEQGWEEVAEAALTHALHTVLAADAAGERGSSSISRPMELPQTTQRLRALVSQFCERLAAGARLDRPTTSVQQAPGKPSPQQQQRGKA